MEIICSNVALMTQSQFERRYRWAFFGGLTLGSIPAGWHVIFLIACSSGATCTNTIIWSTTDPAWVTDAVFLGLGVGSTAFMGGLRQVLLKVPGPNDQHARPEDDPDGHGLEAGLGILLLQLPILVFTFMGLAAVYAFVWAWPATASTFLLPSLFTLFGVCIVAYLIDVKLAATAA